MRKIKLYIAISLNGKIAKANGDVEWLNSIPNPKKNDFGYSEFYKSIDTTIQGHSTYQKILSMGIQKYVSELRKNGIRVEADYRTEKIGYKIILVVPPNVNISGELREGYVQNDQEEVFSWVTQFDKEE